jgi:molybdopterin molybdotransferase
MLSVAAAQEIVLQHAGPLPAVPTPLDASAVGLVLAEDVAADLDLPPFDKALMDGYAVRAGDLASGVGTLTVIEEVVAGKVPSKRVERGEATRVMTGAPMPQGADAVVMIERTKMLDERRVQIEEVKPAASGQNVLARGREMRRGEVVLSAGAVLRPQEFGLLAGVGRTAVKAHPTPSVAILSTGDELVDASETPGPGQIRNGNGVMLLAQIVRAGGRPQLLPIGRDRPDHLRALMTEGLRSDVLVLSGGVSAGKLDLVPGVLAELGIQAHFHKVAMKPGKPVLFGTRPRGGDGPPTLVFGLPGNPVSSLVCFELFVRPALNRLRGLAEPGPILVPATLDEDFPYRTDRPTYHPAVLRLTETGYRIRPVPWFGSQDLRGLGRANAFVVFPEGDHAHRAGQVFPALRVE